MPQLFNHTNLRIWTSQHCMLMVTMKEISDLHFFSFFKFINNRIHWTNLIITKFVTIFKFLSIITCLILKKVDLFKNEQYTGHRVLFMHYPVDSIYIYLRILRRTDCDAWFLLPVPVHHDGAQPVLHHPAAARGRRKVRPHPRPGKYKDTWHIMYQ